MDYYEKVPKDWGENLNYRLKLGRQAERDPVFRKAMMVACREDVLFFFNAFCWLHETRVILRDGVRLPSTIPFNSWPHQDPVIRACVEHLGFKDIGVNKSRCQGATWLALLLAMHDLLFDEGRLIGVVSSTEKKADNPHSMGSLMAKLDWELTKLPPWMVGNLETDWNRDTTRHTLVNLRTRTAVEGFAATGSVGRSGRYKWFFMDEMADWDDSKAHDAMASTAHATDSRLVVSTPQGDRGEWHDFVHRESSAIQLELDWKDNPVNNRGLYTFRGGECDPVDEEKYGLPPGNYARDARDVFFRLKQKGFKLEKSVRSPWYDDQCDRADATPRSIAQELDMDFGGSIARFFTADFFAKAEESVRPPFLRGFLDFHPETLEPDFQRDSNGDVLLWTKLDHRDEPERHPFVLGIDLSSGLGGAYTSNSVAVILDALTLEQVLEFASNTIPPEQFADHCIALAKMFHGAYMIWEIGGPAKGFTDRIQEKHYPNIYLRSTVTRRRRKKTKEVGWVTTGHTKPLMFSALRRAVCSGGLKIRSRKLRDETGTYVMMTGGKIECAAEKATDDPTSQGAAHGDRVVALAVALQGVKDRATGAKLGKELEPDRPLVIPHYSMAARIKANLGEEKPAVWDARSNYDLAQGGQHHSALAV